MIVAYSYKICVLQLLQLREEESQKAASSYGVDNFLVVKGP